MNVLELVGLITILTTAGMAIAVAVVAVGERIRQRQVMFIDRYANGELHGLTDRLRDEEPRL